MNAGVTHDVDAVFRAVVAARERGEEAILVTVVEKEGSGPAEPGAKMLVAADGRTAGTVGGGALELLATRRALGLLAEQSSAFLRYALGDGDAVEGDEPTGMLCGGARRSFSTWASPARLPLRGGARGRAWPTLRPRLCDGDRPAARALTQVPGRAGRWRGTMSTPSPAGVRPGGFHVIATPATPRTTRCSGRSDRRPRPALRGAGSLPGKAAAFARHRAEAGDMDTGPAPHRARPRRSARRTSPSP